MRCVAPASDYDEYVSTGVLFMPFDDYSSATWYTEDLDQTDGYTSGAVIDRSLLRGDDMGLFIKFTDNTAYIGGGSGGTPRVYTTMNSLRVYYLDSAGDTLTDLNVGLSMDLNNIKKRHGGGNYGYLQSQFDPVTDLMYVDLDENLLEQRGYLSVHIGKKSVGSAEFVDDPGGRFYIYSGLPGTPGFTTFEHHPTTYLAPGSSPVTIPRVEIGDLITGGNLNGTSTDLSFVGRNPVVGSDLFRSAINGTVDDVDVTYRPLSFVP